MPYQLMLLISAMDMEVAVEVVVVTVEDTEGVVVEASLV